MSTNAVSLEEPRQASKRVRIRSSPAFGRSLRGGKQISLRLPHETLQKLERLADLAVQTKSQYITKLLQTL